MDRERLTKLMAMTTSSNDGEALNAMRMANKIIKAAGTSWEELLANGRVSVVNISMQRSGSLDEFYQAMEAWQRKKQR